MPGLRVFSGPADLAGTLGITPEGRSPVAPCACGCCRTLLASAVVLSRPRVVPVCALMTGCTPGVPGRPKIVVDPGFAVDPVHCNPSFPPLGPESTAKKLRISHRRAKMRPMGLARPAEGQRGSGGRCGQRHPGRHPARRGISQQDPAAPDTQTHHRHDPAGLPDMRTGPPRCGSASDHIQDRDTPQTHFIFERLHNRTNATSWRLPRTATGPDSMGCGLNPRVVRRQAR
jgi:hypothetical protein